jgi:hypothetical membrane protein
MEIQRDRTARLLVLCGISASILDVLIPAIIGAQDPSYSHIGQYSSEFGVAGRPYATTMSIWFVMYGFLFVGFSIALYSGLPRSKRSWIGSILLAPYGVVNGVGSGIFPCNSGCAGRTFSGILSFFLDIMC